MKFSKYHALGNDYLVLDPDDTPVPLMPEQIRRICHRHFGIGSDGILIGRPESTASEFSLRIFNPDGSEAEKSGNGLRIFSRYLWDQGLVEEAPFTILTAGGKVVATVRENGHEIMVEMGKVSFESKSIPLTGPSRQAIDETIRVEGQEFKFCAASIGNPHCVLVREVLSEAETRHYGPLLENAPCFPQRINVQFMRILDCNNIQIQIWERGAGYTLASGSSSCAAAAVAHQLGRCDSQIHVHMPGGNIDIAISRDFQVSMTGPVTRVADGSLSNEVFSEFAGSRM